MIRNNYKLESGYQKAIDFTKSHYENFPVVSFLIPKDLRKHVAIVYQFARQADDIADEGSYDSEERLDRLKVYKSELNDAFHCSPSSDFWLALSNTIISKNLESQNFYNLLIAFAQDLTKKRYSDFNDLLNYCLNSANPVGRIILELNGIFDEDSKIFSDNICTALQLTNFYQDVSIDIQKDRIYIPMDELNDFGVTEEMFQLKGFNGKFKKLIEFQVDRADELFENGKKLLPKLPLRLRRQIGWTIGGGRSILEKIKKNNFDVLQNRPTLSKFDFLKILIGI